MKVLVHYATSGLKAHGLWWVGSDGNPESLYSDPQSPEAVRGSVIVFGKESPEVSWEIWFDHLTARAPYFETWAVYDSMGFTPEQLLRAVTPVDRLVS